MAYTKRTGCSGSFSYTLPLHSSVADGSASAAVPLASDTSDSRIDCVTIRRRREALCDTGRALRLHGRAGELRELTELMLSVRMKAGGAAGAARGASQLASGALRFTPSGSGISRAHRAAPISLCDRLARRRTLPPRRKHQVMTPPDPWRFRCGSACPTSRFGAFREAPGGSGRAPGCTQGAKRTVPQGTRYRAGQESIPSQLERNRGKIGRIGGFSAKIHATADVRATIQSPGATGLGRDELHGTPSSAGS
eukprot:scaffold651_cov252-Pinguiococcus_pyrenoidosus.AAC.5